MNAEALLERIREKKILLLAEGGHIRYRAPKGALTPELRREIKDHKNELLNLLRDNPGNHNPEVIRRTALFREHLSQPGHSLFFVLPEAEIQEGSCKTCGEGPLSGRLGVRCDLCTAAARIALDLTLPTEEASDAA